MEDEIEGKEARRKARGGWISRELGKEKDRGSKHGDRQGGGRATDRAGQRVGRAWRREHKGRP